MSNVSEKVGELLDVSKRFQEKYDARHTELEERLSNLEVSNDTPGKPGSKSEETQEQREYRNLFLEFVRKPGEKALEHDLAQASRELDQKAVTVGSNSAGGYAVPEEINRQVTQKLRELNPLRQICRVETVSSSDYREIVDVGGTASGWVAEGDSRSLTDTPSLEEVAPTFGTVYARPKISEEAALDIMFNTQRWLVNRAAEELAIQEGQAFISGNGTKKPTGFLNTTPESAGDDDSPARTFGAVQYLPTGDSSGFGELSTGSPSHYPADVLIDMQHSLKSRYLVGPNVAWLMNRSTAGTLRKFKDNDGNYILQRGLMAGQPDMLLGFPIVYADAMPSVASNAHPVAFGNWSNYVICDQGGLRLTVDDNITEPGQISYYLRKRVGGALVNDDGIKVAKCATS